MASPRAEGPDDAAAPRQPLRFPSLRFEEPFQGSSMIEELPMRVAVLLWEVHQELHRWALATRAARAKSRREGAGAKRRQEIAALGRVDPLLREGLEVTAAILEDPAGADPVRVSRACEWIAAWAEERKAPFTRFWFTMHAAACAQFDATLYYRAACIARDAAWWDAAEVNYECAIATAKKCRNRQAQVMAMVGLGNMYYRRGDYEAAQHSLYVGLRTARKYKVEELEGRALHDLFYLAVERGTTEIAENYARQALAVYGNKHPLLPRLAHDVAYYWMSRGHHRRALPVLLELRPYFPDGANKLRLVGNIAHAAGACGEMDVFTHARTSVEQLVAEPLAQAAAAYACLAVALGAGSLKLEECMRRAAQAALELATRRAESDVRSRAAALLEPREDPGDFRTEPPAEEDPAGSHPLVRGFVRALQASVVPGE